MNKLNKVFLIIITILIIILGIFIYLYITTREEVKNISNELLKANSEIEELKIKTNQSTSKKSDNIISSISTFIISTSNDSSISTNDLYQKNMASTFTDVINSNTLKNKLYGKYGNEDKFIIESINEYNTIYRVTLKTNKFDKNKCIEVHNEYVKEFQNLISSIYNIEIVVVDSAS